MLENGYVKLHRSLLTWEWYSDHNTCRLFVHLLLTANYEDKQWRGVEIKRGQRICSRATLAEETGLSERSVRTALNHLETTKEVAKITTPKYTIITVKNYDKYQTMTSEMTDSRPADDQQATTMKEGTNKAKKARNIFVPPTLDDVTAYCRSRGNNVSPSKFIDHYTANGWMVGKVKMMDWKAAVRKWESSNYADGTPIKPSQQRSYKQHEYTPEELNRIGINLLDEDDDHE